MSKILLESFRTAYANMELSPLITPKEVENFRVEYGTEVLEELEQLVEDDPNGSGKIIFTGHRGCGKSTLLAEFCRQMDDRYFTVFFSISDLIEMSDVNHITILFAIAVQLMDAAEKQEIPIKQSIKESFYNWFATKTKTKIDEVGASGSVGFDLFKMIQGKLKADATIREEIKQEFIRKVSDLVARINEIAAVVRQGANKDVIVVIDDLDKLDLGVVRQLYQEHIKALFLPSFRMILTTPISAMREVSLAATVETETNNQVVFMPVTKLFKRGESRKADAVAKAEPAARLKEVLAKRLGSELIEPETLDRVVAYSGGVLRELIRIANECCRICLRLVRRNPEAAVKINAEVFEEAINKLRIDFDTRLGTTDYEMLMATYRDFKPADPKAQGFLDLLHGLYVLEYRNAVLWYDIHPIVLELLKQRDDFPRE